MRENLIKGSNDSSRSIKGAYKKRSVDSKNGKNNFADNRNNKDNSKQKNRRKRKNNEGGFLRQKSKSADNSSEKVKANNSPKKASGKQRSGQKQKQKKFDRSGNRRNYRPAKGDSMEILLQKNSVLEREIKIEIDIIKSIDIE